MKNIFKYISLSLLVLMISCIDDTADRVPDFIQGPNVRIVIDPDFAIFDFENIGNAKLSMDIQSENPDQIESVVISFRFQKFGNPSCANRGCLGPFDVLTITGDDIAAADGNLQGVEITAQAAADLLGMSTSDFGGGDIFFFTNTTTMKDGRVYPQATVGSNTSVAPGFGATTSFTPSFSTFVGCPSNLQTGSYTAVTNGSSTDGCPPADVNPAVDFTSEVTLTALGNAAYNLSDVSGGLYQAWYEDCYGYDSPLPTSAGQNFLDICGNITFPAFSDRFGSAVTITTAFDPATGVITINWSNTFGDAATTVLTPQ